MNNINLTQYITLIVALVFVLGLVYVSLQLLQRSKVFTAIKSKKMNIVSVLPINLKQKVIAIDAFDKKILLGVSPTSINYLTEVPSAKEFKSELSHEKNQN